MDTTLQSLESKKNLFQNKLSDSATAYARNTTPTGSDLSSDAQLASVNKQIDELKSKQIRNKWYGPNQKTGDEDVSQPDGMLIGGLKALQKPLNAVAGTAQYALGKGTESSLAANINESLKKGTTFGDILKQEGVPRAAQIPLGFALDVMFDPVNWLTVGTSALIPRTGLGLLKGAKTGGVKGAIETAKEGLTSSLAKKGSTAMNLVPFARKSAKYNDLAEKLATKAVTGAEKYDSLMGKTVYDKLGKLPFGVPSGIVGDTLEKTVNKIPSFNVLGKNTPKGEEIVDFFKYSPKKAAEIADLKDKVINLARDKGAILVRSADKAQFKSIDDFLKPDAAMQIKDKVGETMDVAIREADGALKPEYKMQGKVLDSLDNAKKLLEVAGEDYNMKHLAEAYKVTAPGKTGVKWYDEVIDSLKSQTVGDFVNMGSRALGKGDVLQKVQKEADDLVQTWNSYGKVMDLKPLEKMLSAQQSFISLFKAAKVPMNVSSHVVSVIGNFFMGAMMGLPVWKPSYLESMKKANDLVKGKLGAAGFKDMFFNDVNSLIQLADNNPTRFKQLTGMDPSEIASKLTLEEKITNALTSKTTAKEALKILDEAWENIDKATIQEGKLSKMGGLVDDAVEFEAKNVDNKKVMKETLGRYETPSEMTSRMLKESPLKKTDEAGTWTTSELTPNATVDKVKEWIATQAANNPNNPAYKLANGIVNSLPRWYEHIDQSFKIGTTDFLTRHGLTEQELITISRSTPITKDDLLEPVVKGAEKLYRVKPLKAAEIATEAYMNYAAMPDFVKIMRAMPIVGSPFMSFPYAMVSKMGKTAVNNPALFNKISFMINEMNTGRTPQEKAALEEKYNQYLKSPTVVKLFGMWNTDVKTYIPYYTMNMFNPSERTYDDSNEGKMLKLMDKFPVMQDPVGQVIKDYFIQPWILSNSGQVPQGLFGQPIYPAYDEQGNKKDVGLMTKALYGGRSIAESVVPGSLSYLGLANAAANLSPEAVEWIPSYGGRNLANATQGRSSIGATTKEDAVRKTFRSLLGRTGVPAYTLDVTKTSSK